MCDEIEESTVFLYVFEEGCPIVVTFSLGESDSVIATARLIVNDRFNTADANEIELRLFYRSEFAFLPL